MQIKDYDQIIQCQMAFGWKLFINYWGIQLLTVAQESTSKYHRPVNKYLFMKILHLTEKMLTNVSCILLKKKKRTERPPKHPLYMHRVLCSFSVTNYSPNLLNTFFRSISLIHKFSKNIKTEEKVK